MMDPVLLASEFEQVHWSLASDIQWMEERCVRSASPKFPGVNPRNLERWAKDLETLGNELIACARSLQSETEKRSSSVGVIQKQ